MLSECSFILLEFKVVSLPILRLASASPLPLVSRVWGGVALGLVAMNLYLVLLGHRMNTECNFPLHSLNIQFDIA